MSNAKMNVPAAAAHGATRQLAGYVVAADGNGLSDIPTGRRVLEGERKILIPNGKGEAPYSSEVADFMLRTRTARP